MVYLIDEELVTEDSIEDLPVDKNLKLCGYH